MKVSWLLRLYGGGGAVGGRTRLLLLRAAKRKRSGPASTVAATTAAAIASSSSKPPKRRPPRRQRPTATQHRNSSAVDVSPSVPLSLAEFHPAIARTWIAAASNKMLQPQHVSPGSRKLAWWICPSCQHQYNRRIDLHLAAGGACPKCNAKPSLNPTPPTATTTTRGRREKSSAAASAKTKNAASTVNPSYAAVAAIAHKCRPQSSQASLAVENANMLSKSVADDQYLRVRETRNLLPMLAKNFDSEKSKIGSDEQICVSPKLDGIRCIVAYRADTQQVLFFSRSGTLFECCDDAIEPAMRHLFENDPTLVLDGELYNDSVNLTQLAQMTKTKTKTKAGHSASSADATAAFYAALLSAAPRGQRRRGASGSGKPATSASAEPVVIRFEQLTSAIRTTRQRLTPAVAALQRQLQYHVFDVLYARDFPNGSAATVPFNVRYIFLEKLLADATAYNTTHLTDYNPLVLRRVPNYVCTLDNVDEVLRAAMRLGYEGVMIRRAGKGKTTGNTPVTAKAKLKRATAAAAGGDVPASSSSFSTSNSALYGDGSGGYGYGQRSSTLLKYKVMQDAEYVVVGAVEGSGKWRGSLGSFICVTPDQKQKFTVTPASTDAEKKRMWRTWKQAYKGKALTVQFQELTPDGVPRFPVGKSIRGAADGHDWL